MNEWIFWCVLRYVLYHIERKEKIIDKKFPGDNTIIIQIYALLTYKE